MKKLFSKVSALVKKASLNYFFWVGCAVLIFLAAIAIFG
jgi:lipoprotein